jgi:uncharacterized protein
MLRSGMGTVGWLACVVCIAACSSGGSAPAPAAPKAAAPVQTTAGREVIIGERVSIRSQILGEERGLIVYRPPPDGASTPYPVIYLLDGDAHFHHVTGLVQFLMTQGLMPRVMVVGLVNTDRTRDFTPTRDPELPTSGGADRFLAFLERELIPAVHSQYPAARYRVLIGHSHGGLLAVRALNAKPDLFDAYIAISPTLSWGSSLMQKQTEALLAKSPELDKALYFAVGNEIEELVSSNRAYRDMLTARAPRTLRWRFEEMDREDHGTIVHRAAYRGLELVFDGWAAPAGTDTLDALERHYSSLSTRFRFRVRVPEARLNLLGYRLMAAGKTDESLAAFRRNVELYPNSANVYDSLAEALERVGDRAAAIQNYELAVRHAARNRDPAVEIYLGRLAAARERAAGTK